MEHALLVLEAECKTQGISYTELSERTGISNTTISSYIHGRRNPSYTTIRRLLRAVGVEIEVTYKKIGGGSDV